MIITRRSILTKKIRHIPINVTVEQLIAWRKGAYIQDAMPHLTPDEREFIMTGITPDEWETMFPDDKEEKP